MLMLLDIAITGGVNLRPNFSPGVFCIDNIKLIPLAYYLSVINPIKQNFLWSPSSNCKHIKLGDKTYLQGNVLYISEKDLKAITNRQDSLLFGREINVIQSKDNQRKIKKAWAGK